MGAVGLIKILRYGTVAGLFLLLLTPLIVTNTLFFPFIAGKAFFFRLLVELLAVGWLTLCLFDPVYRPRRSAVLVAVVALMAVLILATVFSVNPYRSFWSNFERMDGLINYLHLFLFFLIAASVFQTEKLWRAFFITSVSVSVLVAFYGFLQLAGKLSVSQGGVRLDATLGNATYLAVFMLVNIFLALWLWYENRRRYWSAALFGPAIIFQLIILYYTATRGALLGFLAGLGLLGLLLLWRSEQKIWRRSALVALIAMFILGLSFWLARDSSWVQSSPVLSRLASISLTDKTVDARLTVWRMTLNGFKERPVLGWGQENFLLVFSKFYEPKLWPQEAWFDRTHNIFLDYLIHGGILGLLAYLGLFAAALYCLWKNSRDNYRRPIFLTGLLAAYCFNNFFVFDNLTSSILFFALLGYIHYSSLSPAKTLPASAARRFPQKALMPAVLAGGLIVFLLVAYWVNLKPLLAGRYLIKATTPEQTPQSSLLWFKKALAQRTFGSGEATEKLWDAAGWVLSQDNISQEVKQDFLNLSLAAGEEQLAWQADNARAHLGFGIFLLRVGMTEAAIKHLEQARQLSPRKQHILFVLADALALAGQKEKALILSKQIYDLAPDYAEARKFYASRLLDAGKVKEANDVLTAADRLDDRLINAFVAAGDYVEVLALWQERVKANPNDAQQRFSLAAAYFVNGFIRQAIEQLQEAARIDPRLSGQVEYLINEIRAGRNPIQQ